MKNLLTKLKVLAELILAASLIYAAIVYTFSSIFINVLIIIVSLFILAQALGNIDNMNGYNQQKNTNAGFPGSPGFPVNHHTHYPNTGFPASGNPVNDDDDDDGLSSDDTDDLNDNDYPEIPE